MIPSSPQKRYFNNDRGQVGLWGLWDLLGTYLQNIPVIQNSLFKMKVIAKPQHTTNHDAQPPQHIHGATGQIFLTVE